MFFFVVTSLLGTSLLDCCVQCEGAITTDSSYILVEILLLARGVKVANWL